MIASVLSDSPWTIALMIGLVAVMTYLFFTSDQVHISVG